MKTISKRQTSNAIAKKYQQLILDSIDEDINGNMISERKDKIEYLYNRIMGEYMNAYNIRNYGSYQNVVAEWLKGLAINIPYTYHDILDTAEEFGLLSADSSEKEQAKHCYNYWRVMACRVIQLLKSEGFELSVK